MMFHPKWTQAATAIRTSPAAAATVIAATMLPKNSAIVCSLFVSRDHNSIMGGKSRAKC
jgi:hypothetical protein